MAKIKKKELKDRLEYEYQDIEEQIPVWKEILTDNPEKWKEQEAYLKGMMHAFERLMYTYGFKKI